MKKATTKAGAARVRAMRAEYDFSDGVRGKHAERFAKGSNLVLLDPDVAKAFPTSAEVNRALRAIMEVAPRAGANRKKTTK